MDSEIGVQAALELFEAAPCGYLFTQPDGTITRVNQTFLRWTGYTSSDLVDRKRFQELLTAPASIFYETHFSPLLRMQGFVREITVEIVCANGHALPALVNSTIQADAAGVPMLVRTTVFDIRERRRYERELLLERRKAEHLASVVEDASDAIITATRELIVTTWNRGAESLFHYTSAEAVGRNLRDLIVPAHDFEEFDKQLARLLSGHSVQYETTRRDKQGEMVAVSVVVTPRIEPPDEVVGVSAIMRDIRARKRTEEALIRTERLASVGRMAAALAHEINNPLAGAVNSLYLALTDPGTTPAAREFLEKADAELQRITHITRQVLGFYRESNKPALVRVGEVLDSAIQVVQGRAQAKRITIEKQYDHDLEVTAVVGELRQLFSNLLLNSLDAVEEGGRIVVRASRLSGTGGTAVRVTVADTGKGIPRLLMPRVFEPLFTTKGNLATGLGLWVSKEIVQRHGGKIQLRSNAEPPVTWTAVSVQLPVPGDDLPG